MKVFILHSSLLFIVFSSHARFNDYRIIQNHSHSHFFFDTYLFIYLVALGLSCSRQAP